MDTGAIAEAAVRHINADNRILLHRRLMAQVNEPFFSSPALCDDAAVQKAVQDCHAAMLWCDTAEDASTMVGRLIACADTWDRLGGEAAQRNRALWALCMYNSALIWEELSALVLGRP